MHPGWLWTGAAILQMGLVVATAFPPFTPALGVPTWHHNASLIATIVFCLGFADRFLHHRRFLTLGVLVTTTLAIVSGFLLLYLKQDLKDWGLKDWAKWWHILWSWFGIAFFLGHTWINRYGTARAFHRISRRVASGLPFYAAWALILLAIPLTWSTWGSQAIQDPNYIWLTWVMWLVLMVPSYGLWSWSTIRHRARRPRLWRRPAGQRLVDVWLVPMTVLANVSGFPLLYFGTKDLPIKYVAKYWHAWPSIAMTILVFAHSVQFWPGVRRFIEHRARPAPL